MQLQKTQSFPNCPSPLLLPLPAGPESCGCFINQKHGDGLIKKFVNWVFVSHKNLRDFFLSTFGGMLTEHKNPMGHFGKQNNPCALGHSVFQNAHAISSSVLLLFTGYQKKNYFLKSCWFWSSVTHLEQGFLDVYAPLSSNASGYFSERMHPSALAWVGAFLEACSPQLWLRWVLYFWNLLMEWVG